MIHSQQRTSGGSPTAALLCGFQVYPGDNCDPVCLSRVTLLSRAIVSLLPRFLGRTAGSSPYCSSPLSSLWNLVQRRDLVTMHRTASCFCLFLSQVPLRGDVSSSQDLQRWTLPGLTFPRVGAQQFPRTQDGLAPGCSRYQIPWIN